MCQTILQVVEEDKRMILTINKKKVSDVVHKSRQFLVDYREAFCHGAYSCRGTLEAQCYILPEDEEQMKKDGINLE